MNNKSNHSNVLGKVVAGTVVGLAAGAAAIALSDPKTREKIGQKVKGFAEKAQKGAGELEKQFARDSARPGGKDSKSTTKARG